jgi:hypothetical protein
MGLFGKKLSHEEDLHDLLGGVMMSPGTRTVAYSVYQNNEEMHKAAKTLSKEQIKECYQTAFMIMGSIGISDNNPKKTYQIMAIAAMGGEPRACVKMAELLPDIEDVWKSYCGEEEYRSAKAESIG